jgi:hypothetical protein
VQHPSDAVMLAIFIRSLFSEGMRVPRIIFRDIVARTPFLSRLSEPSLQGEGEEGQGITGSTRCVGGIIVGPCLLTGLEPLRRPGSYASLGALPRIRTNTGRFSRTR